MGHCFPGRGHPSILNVSYPNSLSRTPKHPQQVRSDVRICWGLSSGCGRGRCGFTLFWYFYFRNGSYPNNLSRTPKHPQQVRSDVRIGWGLSSGCGRGRCGFILILLFCICSRFYLYFNSGFPKSGTCPIPTTSAEPRSTPNKCGQMSASVGASARVAVGVVVVLF